MSAAQPDIDDIALLNEAAQIDMALLRHVNAQALATTDPDALNGYVRSQQRLTRSLRTTLTTRARLAREGREAAVRAERQREAAEARAARAEREELEDAVFRRIRLEYDPAEADAAELDLMDVLDELWDGDFHDLPRENQVDAVMARLRALRPGRKPATPAPPPRPAAAPPPKPDPEPEPEPAAESPVAAEPAPAPPPPAEEPYVPPWERRPPHARDPGGGGSGW